MNFGKYIFTVLLKTEYDKRVICQARNVVAVTEEAEEAATQSISQGECLKNIIMNSYLYCEDCELLPEILDEVFVVCISCFAMEYDLSEQDYQICEASGRILYPPINNFYMNSEKTFGFIHNRVDTQLLPDSLRTSLTQLTEAEEFTGNRYYFFRTGNTSFAYRAQPFEAIKEFIAQINESIGLWVTIDS